MNAAKLGLKAGIRTFAQAASGGLMAISVAPMISGDMLIEMGNAVAVVFVGAALSGIAAGLQNWAEAL
jgi:hypothetical protein